MAAARTVPRREELHRLRRSLTGTHLEEIHLGPLSTTQVEAMVRSLVAAAPGLDLRGLLTQAGGNPFYVQELVDALTSERSIDVRDGIAELVEGAATAPASVHEVIAERLSFLTERTVSILRRAALLGLDFDIEHLGLLTGLSVPELMDVMEEGCAAGVLTDSDTSLHFRHALIRQALYQTMPASLRETLHRQAGQALAAGGAAVETVAEQLLAAPSYAWRVHSRPNVTAGTRNRWPSCRTRWTWAPPPPSSTWAYACGCPF